MIDYTKEDEIELIQLIHNYLATIFDTVIIGDKTIHPNSPDFGFIGTIGSFKTTLYFFTPDWIRHWRQGIIDLELKKVAETVDYQFRWAGYSYEDGGKPHGFDDWKKNSRS